MPLELHPLAQQFLYGNDSRPDSKTEGVNRLKVVKGYDKFDAKTAGGMHGKHYSHNDYLEKGKTVHGKVFGNLAHELGIEEGHAITGQQFKDLSENKHAVSGEKLTRHVENRKPFCDMTVSIPKSWSIQAIPAGDERVFGYHRAAKDKVKQELHRIVGRQAHNGKEHLERIGMVAGGEYEHDTNRLRGGPDTYAHADLECHQIGQRQTVRDRLSRVPDCGLSRFAPSFSFDEP